MTVALILVVFALLLAGVLMTAVRGHASPVQRLDDLENHALQVDLEAFRNLTDPAEEEFLRIQLPPSEFRRIQRQRLLAAAEYLRRTAHNAALLLRVGSAAQRDRQPEIAAAGRELAEAALRMRISAMLALGLVYARFALPGARLSPVAAVDAYQRLVDGVARLSRLQRPVYATRLAGRL